MILLISSGPYIDGNFIVEYNDWFISFFEVFILSRSRIY